MNEDMMLGLQEGDDMLPQALVEAVLSDIQQEQEKKAQEDLEARKKELHQHLKRWLAQVMTKRRGELEKKWNRWRRNARSIYDPDKLSKKEPWQSKVFIPISMQHKEIIKSSIHRTIVAGLPYNIQPRPSGDPEEAEMLKDLVIREMERSEFELVANDVIDEVCTYGVGFMKRAFVEVKQQRSVRVPRYDPMKTQMAALMGQPPQPDGYDRQPEERIVYRGIKAWHVSIWDLFFDPDASDFYATDVAHRVRLSYQDIVNGVRAGFYFPDAEVILRDIDENPPEADEDKQEMRADLLKSILPVKPVRNNKRHTTYETWCMLPKKWAYLRPEDQHLIDDPEALVPCKVLFTAHCLLAVDENERYDGAHPFDRMSYIEVPGSIYAIGPMEMLEQIQDDMNELCNQKKDNVALILNKMFAVFDNAIVSRADLISKPGGAVRIKNQAVDDVRKALMPLDFPDLSQSAEKDQFDLERFAQELTGVNRATIGSGGADSRDVTETYGGLKLLVQTATERLGHYAQLIEKRFSARVVRGYYVDIYANITPQEVLNILGPMRAAMFRFRTPEEVEQDYTWSPEGVMTNVHRPTRAAQWGALREAYKGLPFFNDFEMGRTIAQAVELPDADKIFQMPMGPDGLPMEWGQMQALMMMPPAPPEGEGPTNGPRPKAGRTEGGA